MSGDVQPRKRKDKRKKKDEEDILHHHGSIGGSDEVIHIQKESKLGGNACAKIVFFGLLAALGVMIGLIIIEYHGSNDVDTQSSSNSPWSVTLEGWVDDSVNEDSHDDDHEIHQEDDHDEHDVHEHVGMKNPKPVWKKDKDDDVVDINKENSQDILSEKIQYHDNEEEPLEIDDLSDLEDEEDETSGENSKLLETVEDVPERADISPSFIERRQTLIPAEIMEDTTAILLSEDNEYAEDQHEEESGEEIDNVSIIKETYEDLKASYNQITPEESDTEVTEEDSSLKINEYATTESEPEPSESDEEEEEPQMVDPLGQWKSDSGPELLAEEVEVIQTESETEEESEDEASSSLPLFAGPKSVDAEAVQYDKSDITNDADWEIKDELDDADKDLEDGDFPVTF